MQYTKRLLFILDSLETAHAHFSRKIFYANRCKFFDCHGKCTAARPQPPFICFTRKFTSPTPRSANMKATANASFEGNSKESFCRHTKRVKCVHLLCNDQPHALQQTTVEQNVPPPRFFTRRPSNHSGLKVPAHLMESQMLSTAPASSHQDDIGINKATPPPKMDIANTSSGNFGPTSLILKNTAKYLSAHREHVWGELMDEQNSSNTESDPRRWDERFAELSKLDACNGL